MIFALAYVVILAVGVVFGGWVTTIHEATLAWIGMVVCAIVDRVLS